MTDAISFVLPRYSGTGQTRFVRPSTLQWDRTDTIRSSFHVTVGQDSHDLFALYSAPFSSSLFRFMHVFSIYFYFIHVVIYVFEGKFKVTINNLLKTISS